jgi:hypothetical protein
MGKTEGQICRLKIQKRQMGDRTKIDLPTARTLRVAVSSGLRTQNAPVSAPL